MFESFKIYFSNTPVIPLPPDFDSSLALIFIVRSSLRLRFEEYKKEMGKREDEKLSIDEISDITSRQNDIDIDMDLEELSLNLSMFVKAVYILSKFIQIYITRSIFDWSHKIKDKDSLNRLLYIVYNGVSNLQIEMADVVKHSLHTYRLVEKYLLLDLEDEVKPLINYFSRITKDLPQDQDNLPLDKMLRISPLDWNTEYLKEYFDPEEYYAEKLQEEANL